MEATMNQLTIDPSILSIFVLVTCLLCLYMVFFFGRRLQTSCYLRESLIEGAKQQELKVLIRELQDRAIEGPLDPKAPPPDGYGRTAKLWEPDKYESDATSSWHPPDENPEDREERLKREDGERERQSSFRKWELEEKLRFETLRQQAEGRALELAEKKIPSSIDISLLGGGWAFLLEFSTVIVIIFTLLILGILGVMKGQDISTILAAIAGYVLGKATSGAGQMERTTGKVPRLHPENRDTGSHDTV